VQRGIEALGHCTATDRESGLGVGVGGVLPARTTPPPQDVLKHYLDMSLDDIGCRDSKCHSFRQGYKDWKEESNDSNA